MNLEIEKKFLCNLTIEEIKKLSGNHFKNKNIESIYILNTKKEAIRVVKDTVHYDAAEEYRLTSKRPTDNPAIRFENELEIPQSAYNIFAQSNYPRVIKTRYHIEYHSFLWEVDVFKDYDFIIAELELPTEDSFIGVPIPAWAYKDVTDDPSYLNCNLAK